MSGKNGSCFSPYLCVKLSNSTKEEKFDYILTVSQDADDREPDLSEEPKKKERAESEVDLETDRSLVVDISDALSEQDKVKYTVHTKVCFL